MRSYTVPRCRTTPAEREYRLCKGTAADLGTVYPRAFAYGPSAHDRPAHPRRPRAGRRHDHEPRRRPCPHRPRLGARNPYPGRGRGPPRGHEDPDPALSRPPRDRLLPRPRRRRVRRAVRAPRHARRRLVPRPEPDRLRPDALGDSGEPPSGLELTAPLWYGRGFTDGLAAGRAQPCDCAAAACTGDGGKPTGPVPSPGRRTEIDSAEANRHSSPAPYHAGL